MLWDGFFGTVSMCADPKTLHRWLHRGYMNTAQK